MANYLRDFFIKKKEVKTIQAKYPTAQARGLRSFFNDKIEGSLNWDGRVIISPNRDIQNEAKLVRASARTLFQQVPYVSKYLDFLSNQVIGPGGVALRATIKTRDGELHTRANTKVMDAWKDFSTRQNLCVNGRTTLLEACAQILKTTALDGEVFVRLVKQGKYGIQIQLLDADYLDEGLQWVYTPTGNLVVMGVETDQWGKAIAYHFRTSHPSDGGMGAKLTRIPAAEVIHVYRTANQGTRMNAVRATSWFAPVFQHLKLLDEYMRYENTAALVSSAMLAFITQDKEAPINVDDLLVTPNGVAEAATVRNTTLEPGTVQYLNPGEKMQQFAATHPSTNFGDFVRTTLKGIATGLPAGLYFILAQSVDDVNFSAGRFGMDDTRDSLRSLQTWLIDSFLEPLFNAWAKTNATQSYTSVRNLDTLDWEWTPRGWDYMQPVDAATADGMNLKNGLTTLERIYQNKGLDWKVEVEQIAAERKYLQELGLSFEAIAPLISAAPVAPPAEQEPAAEVAQEAQAGPQAEVGEDVPEPLIQETSAQVKD